MKLHPQNPLPDPTPKTGLEFLPNDALIMRALADILYKMKSDWRPNDMLIEELKHRSE